MAKSSKTLFSAEPAALGAEVPEGMDEAIYREGQLAKENAVNPFSEGSMQFDSWAAGYAARPAADPEPPVEDPAF